MNFFQTKKIKIPRLSSLISARGWYWLLTIAGLIGILYFGNFLYHYFYKTITQTEEIILLKKEVSPYNLDIATVEIALKTITAKQQTAYDWQTLPNPFDLAPTTPPVPTTSTPPVAPALE